MEDWFSLAQYHWWVEYRNTLAGHIQLYLMPAHTQGCGWTAGRRLNTRWNTCCLRSDCSWHVKCFITSFVWRFPGNLEKILKQHTVKFSWEVFKTHKVASLTQHTLLQSGELAEFLANKAAYSCDLNLHFWKNWVFHAIFWFQDLCIKFGSFSYKCQSEVRTGGKLKWFYQALWILCTPKNQVSDICSSL